MGKWGVGISSTARPLCSISRNVRNVRGQKRLGAGSRGALDANGLKVRHARDDKMIKWPL